MNTPGKPQPPHRLILTAVLSGTLTGVLSLIYLVLSIVAVVYRFDCDATTGDSVSGSSFLLATVYNVYFQNSECVEEQLYPGQITSDYSVFVLVCITLSSSFLCLIAAFSLVTAVLSKNVTQYLHLIVYGYVGVSVAALIVDITFAAHFGVDYSYLSGLMNNFSPGMAMNYQLDVLRIGAFLLMTLTLKGYVSHVINIALLVLLVVYTIQYSKAVDAHEHPIHKLGVIKAFDPKSRSESNAQPSPGPNSNGGPQLNFGYMNDEEQPRTLTRENSRRERDDYSTTSFDRSYSWYQPPPPSQRPFSYLEDSRRPVSERPAPASSEPQWRPQPASSEPQWRPPPASSEPQWRRQPWPGPAPPVPAPDYSPTTPRRLKSALKPAYM